MARTSTKKVAAGDFDTAALALVEKAKTTSPKLIVSRLVAEHGQDWLAVTLHEKLIELAERRVSDLLSARSRELRNKLRDQVTTRKVSVRTGAGRSRSVREMMVEVVPIEAIADELIWIPSVGHIRFADCTAEHAEEKARYHESLSGAHSRSAEWWWAIATQVRDEDVAFVGDLESVSAPPREPDDMEAVA